MRKPACLAVMGISIVVAGASLGVVLTRSLGLLVYSPKGTAQAAASPAAPDNSAAPPAEWNNLFAPRDGMRLASRLPAMDGKSASQAPRSAFVLVGTIGSSSPAMRRAILWANGMKEPKAFREKEEIEPGAILASVERDKVWISRGKEREKLEILPVGSPGRPTAAAGPAAAPSPAASGSLSPVSSTDAPPTSGPAASTRPTPGGTQAVGAPAALPEGEDEELLPKHKRRRTRGIRP
ncbi:MAG: hypothetical protein NCA08_00090 [Deltaproteobacteria bacterium]|nr:hypothetical protein [Candidatus Deferrimicrobium borealis]